MKLSDLARPPIQPHEAEGAEHWICPNHKGLIASSFTEADVGRVYFCPVGREFYRFTTPRSGMYAPLDYPQERRP